MALTTELGGAPAPRSSATTWILIVLLAIILVVGFIIAIFILSSSGEGGVSVVRMEGTLVTGEVSGEDFSASE